MDRSNPVRRLEEQSAAVEAGPAMPGMKPDALVCKTVQPCAHERRGFHHLGENAAGRSGEAVAPQSIGPGHDIGRAEGIKRLAKRSSCRTVSRDKGRIIFRMGDVEPGLAGQQNLAPE